MSKIKQVSILILVLSIGVKLWLAMFNRKLGEKISSQVMMATAADALGDVITTAATILSVVFWRITGINIDGFVGLGVSLVVMWAGFGIAKDTLEPLIGIPATWEDYEKIKHFVEKYDGIEGSHDLVIHNYGPGRSMAIIHAEVPNDVPIDVSHEIIDRIEREAMEQLGISLTIHMDPVETRNEEVLQAKHETEKAVEALDPRCSIHDFRMVNGETRYSCLSRFVDEIPKDVLKEERLEPRLGNSHLRVIAPLKYTSSTIFGLFDCLNQLDFSYRWITRFYCLAKPDSISSLGTIKNGWNGKIKSLKSMAKELIFNQENDNNINENAQAKFDEVKDAISATESDITSYGYYSTAVVVMDEDVETVENKARFVEQKFINLGFDAKVEDLNALDAWFGCIPGNVGHNGRRPMASCGNLVHMMPVSDIWAAAYLGFVSGYQEYQCF